MGKRKHIKSGAGDMIKAPSGLADQIETNTVASVRAQPRGILKKGKQEGGYVPDVLSAKILKEASKQLGREEEKDVVVQLPKLAPIPNFAKSVRKSRDSASSDEEEEALFDDEEYPSLADANPPELPDFLHDEDNTTTLEDFGRNVLNQVEHKKYEFERDYAEGPVDITKGLSEKVVQMYKEIGEYMSYYRSGKIPKAFKSIPTLKNWEQILEITNPEKYTAAAMLHATRQFAANASPKTCEKFYRFYLLPRILDDILEYRKLNVHLFTAIKKAVYKPTAFVKGILLPMCETDNISMNAAHVMKAIIQSTSLPVFHAATAMIKLAQNRPTSSPVSYILTGFIQKRYTLPSLAINAALDYFTSYDEEEPMPLSLHSVIYIFLQHYKLELDQNQKQRLHDLLMKHGNKTARKDALTDLEAIMTSTEAMEIS